MAPAVLQPTAFLEGLLAEPLVAAVGLLIGFTSLIGGATHYGAVLMRQPKHTVERYTGIGFFTGIILGSIAVAFELFS